MIDREATKVPYSSVPSHSMNSAPINSAPPIFDYCDAVWAPTSVTFSKPLGCLHSHFLQNVPVCNSFVKVTLFGRCRFHIAIQVFKILYQLCPGYLKDWFVFTETYTGHSYLFLRLILQLVTS